MRKHEFFIWWRALSIGVAALGAGWMLVELIRVSWRVAEISGIGAIPGDGVVLHKTGELLVAVPFMAGLFLPMFWDKPEDPGRVLQFLTVLMLLGGLLNGFAWFSLRSRVNWHPWCLMLLVWGLLGFFLIRPLALAMLRKRRELVDDKHLDPKI